MKHCFIALCLLLTGFLNITDAIADTLSTPEEIVVSFQRDYKEWNDRSFALHQTLDGHNVMKYAQQRWDELLKKYTLPNFKGEPVAFGSDTSHDPNQEKILSVVVENNSAIVKTRFPQPYYSPEYEYHLIKQNQRWYLTQLYLVDDDGKYPGL